MQEQTRDKATVLQSLELNAELKWVQQNETHPRKVKNIWLTLFCSHICHTNTNTHTFSLYNASLVGSSRRSKPDKGLPFFFYSKHCEAAGIHIRRASNHKLSPSGVFLMSSRHQVPTGKHTCTVSWYCLKLEAPTPRNEPQEDVRYASNLLWSQCFFGDYGLSH